MVSRKINNVVALDRLSANSHFAIEVNPDRSGSILVAEIVRCATGIARDVWISVTSVETGGVPLEIGFDSADGTLARQANISADTPARLHLRWDAGLATSSRNLINARCRILRNDRTRDNAVDIRIDATLVSDRPPQLSISVSDSPPLLELGRSPNGRTRLAEITVEQSSQPRRYVGERQELCLGVEGFLRFAADAEPTPLPILLGAYASSSPEADVSWTSASARGPENRGFDYPFEATPLTVLVEADDGVVESWFRTHRGETACIELKLHACLASSEPNGAPLLPDWRRALRFAARFEARETLELSSDQFGPVKLTFHADAAEPMEIAEKLLFHIESERASAKRTLGLDLRSTRRPPPQVKILASLEDEAGGLFGQPAEFHRDFQSDDRQRVDIDPFDLSAATKPPLRGALTLDFEHLVDGVVLRARLRLPLEFEPEAPTLFVCIDFGASATACWFGSKKVGQDAGGPLPLGDLLNDLAGDHEEYDPRAEINTLIPSHIGISSSRSLRGRLDPLSLGRLDRAGPAPAEVAARLSSLSRRYDISIPFAPRQDMAKHLSAVIVNPKRRLISDLTEARVGGVFEYVRGAARETTSVNVPLLVEEFFDEFGRYTVPRALLRGGPAGGLRGLWLERGASVGLVLTLPSGLPLEKQEVYRRAGQRFLTGFAQSCPEQAWIKLIPEAIAAARYGVPNEARRLGLGAGRHSFITIDIGAGTYDAALIDVELGTGELIRDWTVRTHFAITVGGDELDHALRAKILSLLDALVENPEVDDLVEVAPDLWRHRDGSDTQSSQRILTFSDGILSAKRALSRTLREDPRGSWTERFAREGGPYLRVVVGVEPDGNHAYPVRRLQAGARMSREIRRKIDEIGPTYLVVGQASDQRDGVEMALEIGPGHFASDAFDLRDPADPRTVAHLLGHVLPRMALNEARRLTGPAGYVPPYWVITGRAALWPPLFEVFVRTIRDYGHVPEGMTPKLEEPERMKQAVMRGAIHLAEEPRLSLGLDLLHPLAVLRIDPTTHRILSLNYVENSEHAVAEAVIDCDEPSHLVRALPGLHPSNAEDTDFTGQAAALLELFGVKPYQGVQHDIASPRDRFGSRQVRLRWRRQGGRIHIAVDGDQFHDAGFDQRIYGAPLFDAAVGSDGR